MHTVAISLSTHLNFVSSNGGNSKSYVWQVRSFFTRFSSKSHFNMSETWFWSSICDPEKLCHGFSPHSDFWSSKTFGHWVLLMLSWRFMYLCCHWSPHKAGLAHMAPLRVSKDGRQWFNHRMLSVPCCTPSMCLTFCALHPPPSFLFFPSLCVPFFQTVHEQHTHTHARPPENHESFMQAGSIIPEACSLRPTPTRLHHLEREGKPSLGEREGDWHIEMERWTRRERNIHQERGWRWQRNRRGGGRADTEQNKTNWGC